MSVTTLVNYDLNTLENAGSYIIEAPINGPDTGNYFALVIGGNIGGKSRATQLLTDVADGAQYSRTNTDAGWTAWTAVGAGGSEADTVFARAIGGYTSTIQAVGADFRGTGTISVPALALTSRATATKRSRITSAASTNIGAQIRVNGANSAGPLLRGSGNLGGFDVTIIFSIATFAETTRGFFGLTGDTGTTTPITSANASTLTNIFGVGFDPADANFHLFHNDGADAATELDLGEEFPVAVDTLYKLNIMCAPGATGLVYTLTNLETLETATGTVTTDIPAASQPLCPISSLSTGAGAASVALDHVNMYYTAGDISLGA